MSEQARHEQFGKAIFEIVKECITEGCFEIDTDVLAEAAVKAGLMTYEPFDPQKHDWTLNDSYRPGDMIYYWGKPADSGEGH